MYGEERIVKESSRRQELGYRYYHLSTVNAAIRRDVWESTRFPEELKIFEDVGIAKRILDRGWKIVYEPKATVYHSDNHTSENLFKRYFDLGVVWKQLGVWDETTHASLFREGWRLLRRKLAGTNGTGNGHNHHHSSASKNGSSRLSSLVQDTAKYAGLMLGKHEHLLPLSIKRKMSGARMFN